MSAKATDCHVFGYGRANVAHRPDVIVCRLADRTDVVDGSSNALTGSRKQVDGFSKTLVQVHRESILQNTLIC